jgi:hypothetical protein
MFGSSLPPDVCGREHVVFTLFVFDCYSGVQRILCCVLFYFSSSCVPYVASFPGLSCFWLPVRYSLTFISLDCPVFNCPFGILWRLFPWIVLILIARSVFSDVYLPPKIKYITINPTREIHKYKYRIYYHVYFHQYHFS